MSQIHAANIKKRNQLPSFDYRSLFFLWYALHTIRVLQSNHFDYLIGKNNDPQEKINCKNNLDSFLEPVPSKYILHPKPAFAPGNFTEKNLLPFVKTGCVVSTYRTICVNDEVKK